MACGLNKQRIRDFASDRKITKEDRKAWNNVLYKAAKDDYKKWVEGWVEEIEKADEMGDARTI